MFGEVTSPQGVSLGVYRYIIEMFLGPNFIPNKPIQDQPYLLEHLAYFTKQLNEGNVLLAGPYRAFDGAYVVLSEQVTSYGQAVKIMKGDPWDIHGMSVAVVRILRTNPLPLPKQIQLTPPDGPS